MSGVDIHRRPALLHQRRCDIVPMADGY